MAPLRTQMAMLSEQRNKGDEQLPKDLQKNLNEVQGSLDNLGKSYFVKQLMDEATYQKFRVKYVEKKGEILQSMQACSRNSSNLEKYLEKALLLSSEVATVWRSSPAVKKEVLQKLMFPEGV
ncbi:MAG: hypothetical protein QM530_10645 [Phycisphaerales bacterium]|nr:hypothetical protein [Phycisphaerales bacterium]